MLLLAFGTPVRPPAEAEVGIAENERGVDMVGIVLDERT